MSPSHKVADDTEEAYWRSDSLEKRRQLMEAWGQYVEPPNGSSFLSKPANTNIAYSGRYVAFWAIRPLLGPRFRIFHVLFPPSS